MKQVFEANTKLRRVICAVLVAIMVIGMIPLAAPKAAALSKGDKLYFDANHWDTGNAWFAAYFFGNGTTYVTMKDSNDDGVYVCDVPGSYSSVIFLRMDPSVSTPSFDNGMWNKTADLTPGSNNFFAPSNNGWTGTGGTWSSYTCTHSGHGQNGVCTNCESTKVHNYVNGSCSCGVVDPSFNPTYYLVGSINGEDYGIEDDHANLGDYKFVNGTLTAIFTAKTDVMIKTDTDKWYMTETYVKTTSATFYDCDTNENATQKMNIPVGVEVTFTLVENSDGTLTLSFTKDLSTCTHVDHNTEGKCEVCGATVSHSWTAATCSAPKTCSVCGATEGDPAAHSWNDATCTAPKTCSKCGATDGSALGHNYVNGSCTRCGAADPNSKVAAYLAGEMNDWSTTSNPLYGSDGVTGSVTIELEAGTYEFKIIAGGIWYGNNGTVADTTTATSSSGWVMVAGDNIPNCKLQASGGTYTFTFNTSTKTLVILHNSSGGSGGGTTDDTKLYVGTTFYDYRTDDELDNKSLSSREWWDACNDSWYVFRNFNYALSDYYNSNNVKVPIYMGHFQPQWGSYGITFAGSGHSNIYGFKSWVAAGNNNSNNTDQKWFMSVNNSLLDIDPNDDEVYNSKKVNYAAWGIVHSSLVNNKLMAATTSGTIAHPLFDETFLSKKYNRNTYANIYHDVQFPFGKSNINGIEYWVFDSEKTTLKMNSNYTELVQVTNPGDGFKNRGSNNELHSKTGFFPFNTGSETTANQYNYGFGMRLDIPFNLTADGKIADKYGDKQDIIYEFSGDDDVWVFIDGVLVLDIGGSHGKVTGSINFATMTATVSNVKSSLGNTNPKDADSSKSGYQTTFELPKAKAGEHTLTMFYMERGMWESNMSIRFNFIPDSSLWNETTTFSVQKQWNVADTNVIPSSVTVQLQRRLQGAAEWTVVENKTLTSANQGAQRVDHVWVYTWENLANFEGETLYEYRVVELDNNNNVLSNGKQNGNTMVAYGDVAGSGATGYTQIISNNQVANPVVVVIDFGLSVDVHVNTEGTLEGVGNTLKLPVGTKNYKDSNVVSSVEGKHGVATVVTVDDVKMVRYTLYPNNMMMDSADNIGFCVNMGNGNYNYSTLTVIPAANIYYEDNFLNFSHATNATESFGRWGVEGRAIDKIQAEDRPGALTSNDANNVYGYDQAYDNFTTYSLGSARKVTVNAATGKPSTAPTASFSFTGTGFDVVSLTDNTSGAISVEVKRGNAVVLRYVVNNFYGMIYDNGSWTVDKSGKENALYQVPVIKVENLQYGTYDVTIRAAYMDIMDKTAPEGYTIWVDAIRIYNPALNDKTSNDAYLADGESNPHLTTLKKLLVDPGFDAYYDVNADVEINGVVFVEGKDDVVSMAEYANQGPNNETYLKNGNSVVFKFRIKDVVDPDVGPQIGLQIGAKLAIGDEATLKVALNNSSEATTVVTTRTATNMFYKLPQITWEKVDGGWESCPIMFMCEAAEAEEDEEDDILSLTDLKLTGPDADFATYVNVSDEDNTEEANIQTFVDYECYSYAVNVMSAPVVNPVTLTGNSFSLSFEDEILVNYYYAISDVTNVTEHGMLVFNTDPGAADIAKADQKYDAPVFVESENLFACTTSGIAAKEMGDTRYYCAYAKLSDGTIVYSDLSQYSPKHYAMSRLENSENENLKALCVAMLNYGAAAQSYFGYKTDALMNADLTDAQKALVGEYNADLFTGAVAADPAKVNGCFASTEAGFEQISASVSFEGAFALNFYFDLDRENSEVVFYYWTKEAYDSADELSDTNFTGSIAATADANGIFYAPITGIAAKELDDTVYVAATYTIDGETFCSGVIAYSLSTYCMRHANGNMGQLAQATAMYGYYAENYFGVSSQELI